MTKRTTTIAACAAGLAAGLVLAPVQSALAGHTNAVLEAELDGRSEVATGGDQGASSATRTAPARCTSSASTATRPPCATSCWSTGSPSSTSRRATAGGPHPPRAEGTNGPIEVNLAWPQDGQAGDCLTEGEPGKGLDAGEVQEILANPHDFYVNVHNSEHPSGAIRGQLHAGH